MTKAKSDGFDTPAKLDRFLRTKLKNKGLHTQWKRYGSWTFTDNDGCASHLYAWSTTKGTQEHGYVYNLDESQPPLVAFDDLLLLRFPEDNKQLSLHRHLPITPDHVKEWLACVLPIDKAEGDVAKPESKPKPKPKPKQKSKKGGGSSSNPKKPQKGSKSASAAPKEESSVDTLDEPNASDDDQDSNVLDAEEADATAEDENILEDTLDDNDNDKELLLEEDDDDEEDCGSDDETAKMSDDEDDDFESAFDTDMLQCEPYTYNKPNKLVGQPLLLSLWTH